MIMDIKLLLGHPDTFVWVHATTYINNPIQNHQELWPERDVIRRLRILVNTERYVLIKTGRPFIKSIVTTKTDPFWLLTSQPHCGTMDTQNPENWIYNGHEWLCSKVRGNRKCASPAQRPTTQLQNHNKLGWDSLIWNDNKMGWTETHMWYFYAHICHQHP